VRFSLVALHFLNLAAVPLVVASVRMDIPPLIQKMSSRMGCSRHAVVLAFDYRLWCSRMAADRDTLVVSFEGILASAFVGTFWRSRMAVDKNTMVVADEHMPAHMALIEIS
jgi:hypothetical protein